LGPQPNTHFFRLNAAGGPHIRCQFRVWCVDFRLALALFFFWFKQHAHLPKVSRLHLFNLRNGLFGRMAFSFSLPPAYSSPSYARPALHHLHLRLPRSRGFSRLGVHFPSRFKPTRVPCGPGFEQPGNLGRVDMLSECEYDLHLRPDTKNLKQRIWFDFTVRNCKVRATLGTGGNTSTHELCMERARTNGMQQPRKACECEDRQVSVGTDRPVTENTRGKHGDGFRAERQNAVKVKSIAKCKIWHVDCIRLERYKHHESRTTLIT
jgi:hypothetical protein